MAIGLRAPRLPKADLPAKIANPKPPKLSTTVKAVRPTLPRRTAVFPRGKRLWKGPKPLVGGPGVPPPGFKTPTTSGAEWYVYWALWILMHEQGDVRQPHGNPMLFGGFTGGVHFGYQIGANRGRQINLGSVTDFVVYMGLTTIWLRVDTAYFHSAASPQQKARDLYVRQHGIPPGVVVRSVYDSDFMYDASGKAVLRTVQEALQFIQRPNPASSGTFYAPPYAKPGLL